MNMEVQTQLSRLGARHGLDTIHWLEEVADLQLLASQLVVSAVYKLYAFRSVEDQSSD